MDSVIIIEIFWENENTFSAFRIKFKKNDILARASLHGVF